MRNSHIFCNRQLSQRTLFFPSSYFSPFGRSSIAHSRNFVSFRFVRFPPNIVLPGKLQRKNFCPKPCQAAPKTRQQQQQLFIFARQRFSECSFKSHCTKTACSFCRKADPTKKKKKKLLRFRWFIYYVGRLDPLP